MATIREIITSVDELRQNTYNDRQKAKWINEVDGYVKDNCIPSFLGFGITRIANQESYTLPTGILFDDIEIVYFDTTIVPRIDLRSYKEVGYFNINGNIGIYPVPTVDDATTGYIKVIYKASFTKYRTSEYVSGTSQISFTGTTITTTGSDFSGFVIGDTINVTGCVFNANNNKSAVITGVAAKVLTFASGSFANASESGIVTVTRELTDTVLIIDRFQRIYEEYILAQIDFYNKDYDDYNNMIQKYNDSMKAYQNWATGKQPVNKSAQIKNIW